MQITLKDNLSQELLGVREYVSPIREQLSMNPQYVLCASGEPTEIVAKTEGEW